MRCFWVYITLRMWKHMRGLNNMLWMSAGLPAGLIHPFKIIQRIKGEHFCANLIKYFPLIFKVATLIFLWNLKYDWNLCQKEDRNFRERVTFNKSFHIYDNQWIIHKENWLVVTATTTNTIRYVNTLNCKSLKDC